MAALLGVEGLQQPEKTDDYQDMLSVYDELNSDEIKDVWENIWTGDTVRKVVDIQAMDRLFGVKRERKDYLAKISHTSSEKVNENGDTYKAREYNYDEIVACKLDEKQYFIDKLETEQVNNAMNFEFATKLANLNFDDQDFAKCFEQLLKPLLGDNYDKLKKKIQDAGKLVKDDSMVLIRKDLYKVTGNMDLIDTVLEGDCAFHTSNSDDAYALRGDKVVDKKQYSKRKALNNEHWLNEWLENNKSKKNVSEDFEQVCKAIEDYKKEIDSDHWLSASYYDSFEKMVHTMRQWYNKKDKNEEEAKLCESLSLVYIKNYIHHNLKGLHEKVRLNLDLDKRIEECQKEDAAAEKYYKLKLKAGKAEKLKHLKEGETEKQINDKYEENCKNIFIDKTNVPLFPHKPCVEDIEQGGLGDCFLLASIAAMVQDDPMNIRRMIQDYGTIAMVRFGDKKVYVSKKIARKSSAKNALWVQIIEKAYAKAFGNNSEHQHYAACKNLVPYVEEEELEQAQGHSQQKSIDNQKYDYVRELYFASTDCIDIGGIGKEALNNLNGFTKTQQLEQRFAFTSLGGRYESEQAIKKLWESAISEDASQEKSEVKRLIRDKIQDKLWDEIDYRIRGKFRNCYRAVTIEDFRDTLNDIKNWKNQDVGSVFYWLLSEVKSKFPGENESTIMEYMNQLGEGFMKAGIKQDKDSRVVYGYRADLDTKTPYYTPKAIDWYNKMKEACDKKLAITCGCNSFANLFYKYTKDEKPTVNGLEQAHEYTVTDVYEKDQHYFVTIRNPWRSGIVEYRRKTKADGSVEITMEKQGSEMDISRGEFSLELNDFMNAFNVVAFINAGEKNSK